MGGSGRYVILTGGPHDGLSLRMPEEGDKIVMVRSGERAMYVIDRDAGRARFEKVERDWWAGGQTWWHGGAL
jgi:hypothetical protein